MKSAALPKDIATAADEVRATIAANLSNELSDQRWTKRSAASALGLTHTYVNSRAIGAVELSGSDLAMFARFLKVPVARFFEPRKSVDVVELDTSKNSKLRPMDYNVGTPTVTRVDFARRRVVNE